MPLKFDANVNEIFSNLGKRLKILTIVNADRLLPGLLQNTPNLTELCLSKKEGSSSRPLPLWNMYMQDIFRNQEEQRRDRQRQLDQEMGRNPHSLREIFRIRRMIMQGVHHEVEIVEENPNQGDQNLQGRVGLGFHAQRDQPGEAAQIQIRPIDPPQLAQPDQIPPTQNQEIPIINLKSLKFLKIYGIKNVFHRVEAPNLRTLIIGDAQNCNLIGYLLKTTSHLGEKILVLFHFGIT